jgi:prepilin-type N-terminal cleavage/methylation domain-containing protein
LLDRERNEQRPRERAARGASARNRGFTLVEILVAMSAGVLVSIAALLLARNATRFFQHEARISAAQLAATLGMNRLTADLQRASFLAAPTHYQGLDNKLCQEAGPVPAAIRNWTGIAIRARGSQLDHAAELAQGASPDNNLFPDSVILGGSFATTERFTLADASPTQVTLQNDEAIGRLRTTAARSGRTLNDALTPILVSGRFLRVLNYDGVSTYGIIRGFAVNGAAPLEKVTISLDASAPLVVRGLNGGKTCGISGLGTGLRASVIYNVKYDIRSLQGDPSYARLVAFDPATAVVSGEDTRTELVRVELDENGVERPATRELVAELAVDLKFGVSKVTQSSGATPVLTTFPFESIEVATTPELIRAVQVRLSTRTRVPDREQALSPLGGPSPYHFAVKPAPLTPRYARMRTLNATVALPNQAGFSP